MLALAGGNEFGALSRGPDAELAARAGGAGARVAIVPTAAVQRPRLAASNGVRHFSALGAQAEAVMIVDRVSAADPALVARLDAADLVYLTGGDPWYLLSALRDTPTHEALRRLHGRGKIVAGSSAGAMALSALMRRREGGWLDGLGLAAGIAVLVHADEQGVDLSSIGARRAGLPPHVTLVAVDAQTVLVGEGASWRNLGPGRVIVAPVDAPPAQYDPGDRVSW